MTVTFPSSSTLKTHCFAVQCEQCGKTTWKGCGRHIDSVMNQVPQDQKCTCPRS